MFTVSENSVLCKISSFFEIYVEITFQEQKSMLCEVAMQDGV